MIKEKRVTFVVTLFFLLLMYIFYMLPCFTDLLFYTIYLNE